jgi:molybdopterin synthase sulfur carrier subunit
MVSVRLPSMLHALADGQGQVEVPAGTLGEALDEIRSRYPELERRLRDEQGELRDTMNFFIDGEECRLMDGSGTVVRDRNEVVVIPAVAPA